MVRLLDRALISESGFSVYGDYQDFNPPRPLLVYDTEYVEKRAEL